MVSSMEGGVCDLSYSILREEFDSPLSGLVRGMVVSYYICTQRRCVLFTLSGLGVSYAGRVYQKRV